RSISLWKPTGTCTRRSRRREGTICRIRWPRRPIRMSRPTHRPSGICSICLSSIRVEVFQHAGQGEVAIAAQRQGADVGPVGGFGDVESDPALVAEVGGDLEAFVCRHESLRGDAYPEIDLEASLAVGVEPQEGLFAGAPDGGAELLVFDHF